MTNVIISGEAHGFGSDQWRWVSYLSKEAKEALKNTTALVVCERPFSDRFGDWYVVTYKNARYNHRLPKPTEQKLIEQYVN